MTSARTALTLAGALVFGLGTSPLPNPTVPVSCGEKFDDAGAAYRDGYLSIASALAEECLVEQPEHAALRSFHGKLQEELAAVLLDPDPERRAKALRVTLPGPWDLPAGAPQAPDGTDFVVLLAEAEAMAAAGDHTQALLMTRQAHTLQPDCTVCRERVSGYWDAIEAQLRSWIEDETVDVVISTGGTGVTGRDTTPEAFHAVYDKEIPGFGELFRWLSYANIGTSTIQSRATGGVANGTYLFALPGSTGACKDAWDGILVSQLDSRFRPCNFVELMPRLKET